MSVTHGLNHAYYGMTNFNHYMDDMVCYKLNVLDFMKMICMYIFVECNL
jgi:hypothetical protein